MHGLTDVENENKKVVENVIHVSKIQNESGFIHFGTSSVTIVTFRPAFSISRSRNVV